MISEAKKKRVTTKMHTLAGQIIDQAKIRDRAEKKIFSLENQIRKLGESICEHRIRDNSESYIHPHNGDLVEHDEYKCEKCSKLFDKEAYIKYCVDSLRE